jgi:molybdopterin synthase catalytic subunit
MVGPLRKGAGKEELLGLFKEAVCNRKPYWSEGRIREADFDIQELTDSLRSPKAGCIVSFIGTVRDFNEDRDVESVELESYSEMAEKELENIIEEVQDMYLLEKVEVRHRSGKLKVGENIVFIGVSAPHREDGYDACRYIIDEIKTRVPLFKKERTRDGKEVWLKGEEETDDDGGHN